MAWIVAPESLALKRDRETLAAVTVVVGRIFRGPEFEAPDFYLGGNCAFANLPYSGWDPIFT